MNRNIENYFAGVVVLKVSGRKIERFLTHLYKLKINILQVNCIDRQTITIKVFNKDIDRIMSIKTTYEIEIISYEGKLRLKEGIRKHLFLFIALILGYIFLVLLSNMIFDVEVIHSNTKIRHLIIDELAERNIKKWHFKPDFKGIERIKEEILNEYKDKIEWLEIENIGTKYIVKLEERKIKTSEPNYQFQDIVSTKNAIIMKIEATDGEIVKRKNDYVKKGDVLISGKIMKGEEVTKLIKANGKIYGEVWYNIKVEHPMIYQIRKKTGKEQNIYQFIFLNHKFSVFNRNRFKDKVTEESNIVSHPLIPFRIVKTKEKEITIQDETHTDGEAIIMAENLAIKKMKEYLGEDEYILSQRKLKYYIEDNKLHLELFFKTYENIGEPRLITE